MSTSGANSATPRRRRGGAWLGALLTVVLLGVVALAVRAHYAAGPSAAAAHSAGAAGFQVIFQVLLVLFFATFELVIVVGLIYIPWRRLRELGKNDGASPLLSRRSMWRLAPLPFVLILAQVGVLILLLRRRRTTGTSALIGATHHAQHIVGPIVASQALTQASLLAAGLLGLGALLVVLNRERIRRWLSREVHLEAALPPGELSRAVEAGLEELEAESDPRRAVIAAYVGMERALSRRGLPPERHETPLEYLERVLGAMPVNQPNLGRLTRLFELARFSHRPVDEEMRSQAESSLRQLRQELSLG